MTQPVFEWLGGEVEAEPRCVWKLAERLNLNEKTVRHWANKWKMGVRTVSESGGQLKIDEAAAAVLLVKLRLAQEKSETVTEATAREFMSEAIKDTATRQGRVDNGFVSDFVFKSVTKRYGLQLSGGQEKTEARAEAERCPLAALSTFVMFFYIFTHVASLFLVWNFDATKFFVGGFDKAKRVLVSIKGEDAERPVSGRPAPGSKIRIGIKWYSIISAAGKCGPLVFHMIDPDMTENDNAVYAVPGLCVNDISDEKGYICFTKEPNGNGKFYNWLLGDLIAPWIDATRAARVDDTSAPACFMCDGEDTQIMELADPVLVKKLKDMGIFQGKLHASTTAVSQPCDAHKIFSACRANIEGLLREPMPNPGLSAMLKTTVFSVSEIPRAWWDAGRRARAVEAMTIVREAIAKTLNSNIIKRSFAKAGMIDKKGNLDAKQIFANFGFKLNAHDLAGLMEDVQRASKVFGDKGRLTDAELVSMFRWTSTPSVRSRLPDLSKPRDGLTICRQRCVLMLNEVLQPELQARRKRLIQEQKEKAKVRKADAKKRQSNGKKRPLQEPADQPQDAGGLRKAQRVVARANPYARDAYEYAANDED